MRSSTALPIRPPHNGSGRPGRRRWPGRGRVKAGRGQLGPDLPGELGRGHVEQVDQRRPRVMAAGGEPQRVDHLPGRPECLPDMRVAELAGHRPMPLFAILAPWMNGC
jgi:hypothetical protein